MNAVSIDRTSYRTSNGCDIGKRHAEHRTTGTGGLPSSARCSRLRLQLGPCWHCQHGDSQPAIGDGIIGPSCMAIREGDPGDSD